MTLLFQSVGVDIPPSLMLLYRVWVCIFPIRWHSFTECGCGYSPFPDAPLQSVGVDIPPSLMLLYRVWVCIFPITWHSFTEWGCGYSPFPDAPLQCGCGYSPFPNTPLQSVGVDIPPFLTLLYRVRVWIFPLPWHSFTECGCGYSPFPDTSIHSVGVDILMYCSWQLSGIWRASFPTCLLIIITHLVWLA